MIKRERRKCAIKERKKRMQEEKKKGDCNKPPLIIILKIFYLQPNLYHSHYLIF